MQRRLRRFITERIGARALVERLRQAETPSRDPTHYLAFVLLFLFSLAAASGILLLLEYWPGADRAHDSIVHIEGRVPFGNLVRGVHVWSSQLLVVGLITQLVVYVAMKRHAPPRELVWLSSLTLLALGVGLAFTGSILPWTEQAYLQARVSSDLASHAPLIGGFLGRLLRGGRQVDGWTLHHAFAFHVGVLPAAATLAILVHTWLARRAHQASGRRSGPTIPLYPDFAVRLAAVCVLVLAVVLTLTTLVRVPLGEAANLSAAPTGPERPPWYFLFLHELLLKAPARMVGVESADFVMGALTVLAVIVALLPFIDRKGSRVTLWGAGVLVLLYVGLTTYALV